MPAFSYQGLRNYAMAPNIAYSVQFGVVICITSVRLLVCCPLGAAIYLYSRGVTCTACLLFGNVSGCPYACRFGAYFLLYFYQAARPAAKPDASMLLLSRCFFCLLHCSRLAAVCASPGLRPSQNLPAVYTKLCYDYVFFAHVVFWIKCEAWVILRRLVVLFLRCSRVNGLHKRILTHPVSYYQDVLFRNQRQIHSYLLVVVTNRNCGAVHFYIRHLHTSDCCNNWGEPANWSDRSQLAVPRRIK